MWEMYDACVANSLASAIVIPTNGSVKRDKSCVMGAGLAKDAKERWHNFPYELGRHIKANGNIPCYFDAYHVITFPVKHHWYEMADLTLIEKSAKRLAKFLSSPPFFHVVYVPRVGCGNGRLSWKLEVKPLLEKYLESDRFVVVYKGG